VLARADLVVKAARLNHWFNVPLPSEMGRFSPTDTQRAPAAIPLTVDTLGKKK
jgi:hypothetical protein